MSGFIFLDSGPLGLITHPQLSSEVLAIRAWVRGHIRAGNHLIVPAIIYYELKRELLRANKASSLERLENFVYATPKRYLPVSDEALRLAASLWAQSRKEGRPTTGSHALDIDVILAAQVLSFGVDPSQAVVATTNVKHLAPFVAARNWNDIPIL